jgi:phosphatidylinositol alpha-mannosyltransferase
MEVTIIPNGVDVAALSVDTERHPHRVVFLGRDEPRKGLDLLVEAWSKVSQRFPDAELVVMGADRGSPDVEWMRRVDDETKARILSSAAVFVAPNTGGESFGIVLVEAMAAGAAVLASDLQAFVDVGGDAVRFFRKGDNADLADELLDLLGDDDGRPALGRRGEARARQFDWSKVATSYRDVYTQALL